MASVQIRCKNDKCRRRFRKPAQSRRQFCETCRPPRERGPIEAPPSPTPIGPGECERAVRADLERAGRADAVPGVLACRLARQLDDATLTGAQAASLARQVQELLASAMAGVAPPRDFVDEMAERRQARGGA